MLDLAIMFSRSGQDKWLAALSLLRLAQGSVGKNIFVEEVYPSLLTPKEYIIIIKWVKKAFANLFFVYQMYLMMGQNELSIHKETWSDDAQVEILWFHEPCDI